MNGEAQGEAEYDRDRDHDDDDAQSARDVGIDGARGKQGVKRRRHLGRRNDGLMPDQARLAGKLERADHRHDHRKTDQADARHPTAVMPACPSALSDSPRKRSHSRAVISPKAGSATILLSRSRGQPVSMISMKRPGRADMAPTLSASMAASSSAWVISSTVAPVRRHSRNTSSPMSSRVCASSAPNGSSSRMSRGCSTSVRAMHTRWRMPPDNCDGYARAKSLKPMKA